MTRSIGRITRGAGFAVLVAAVALTGAATTAAGAQAKSRPDIAAGTPSKESPASASPVPKGFRSNSITWLSSDLGWVLGSARCITTTSPDSAPQTNKTCSYVIGTTNGGKTWSLIGSVDATIATIGQSGEEGVTEIRFATREVGFVFGPELLRTTNGGRSWTSLPIPGGGKQVSNLVANSHRVYAVVSQCRWASSGPSAQQSYTFWRTAKLTGRVWTRISLNMAPAKGMYNSGADVALYGETVYVLRSTENNEGTIVENKFYASTDGLHFSVRPDPCDTAELFSLIQAVPTSATDVALLCEGEASMGLSSKSVFRSTNTGKTDHSAGTPPADGDYAELAVSSSGNLAVSADFGASWIYINDTHKTTWSTAAELGDGGLGWNDIVYVTNKEAWIVRAPADDIYRLAPAQIFVTNDGGGHWTVATL